MQIIHNKQFLSAIPAFTVLLVFSLLLVFTYRNDNKYTAGPPYGQNGLLAFSETDLETPLFLIDGWMLDGKEVFIGQYSNFSYVPGHNSPFGSGTYSLTLRYEGAPRTLLLEIPDIFTKYTLYIDGEPAISDGEGTQISVTVGGKDTLLTLQTTNQTHYYSGLTYPPALGTPGKISRLFYIRTLIYTAVCFSGLTLALFSSAVWLSRYRDKMFFHFGLLCLAFSIHCAHPLVWQAGGTSQVWYAIEDASWLFVLAQTIHLAVLSVNMEHTQWYRRILRPFMLLICLISIVLTLYVIPGHGGFISFYGAFIDGYKISVWAGLSILAGIGWGRKNKENHPFVLGSAVVLGFSVLADVWDSNQFEPIYGLWQNEYAGILMIFLFGCMMVRRILVLLKESKELQALSIQYRFAAESAVQMKESAAQVRIMKHELNHHIEALSALCLKQDYKRLEEYLTALRREKNNLSLLSYSGHFLVNAVLSSYLQPAQQAGIETDCRILVPDALPVDDAELCTLLSNILQNAVEACSGLPDIKRTFIHFEMSYQNGLLSFSCINTSKPGNHSKTFATTKEDRANHGFGLPAIYRIAEKYNGTVDAVQKDGIFTIRGVLSLPPIH